MTIDSNSTLWDCDSLDRSGTRISFLQKLWIDDCRDRPDASWLLVRTSDQAIDIIKHSGMPDMISFDHDLGGDDTAMKVVHFIINSWLDKTLEIPKNFEYFVHSANPVGADNIRGTMDRFLQEVNSVA